jgi:hypothetical protein
MKYTVFENKKSKGRFISNYTEVDNSGWYNIIGHSETYEDAKAMCDVSQEININNYLGSLPDELRSSEMDDYLKWIIRNAK